MNLLCFDLVRLTLYNKNIIFVQQSIKIFKKFSKNLKICENLWNFIKICEFFEKCSVILSVATQNGLQGASRSKKIHLQRRQNIVILSLF